MRRFAFLSVLTLMAMTLVLQGCETTETMMAGSYGGGGGAKAPVVTLERVDVNHIQPFYMGARIGFKDCNNPGTVGGYGYTSTLSLAYIFAIQNPGNVPVQLDEMRFIIAFEDFDVNMPTVYEKQWVPPGKTNELRVVVVQEAQATVVNLMVGGVAANRIKQMGTTQGAVVQKWWDTVGDMAFPIQVKAGVANFKTADGKTMMTNFEGVFPKK